MLGFGGRECHVPTWDTAVTSQPEGTCCSLGHRQRRLGVTPLCAHGLGSSISLFVSFGNENYLLWESRGFFSQVDKCKPIGLAWGVQSWGELLMCVQDVLADGLTLLLKKLNQFEVGVPRHFLGEQRGEAAACSSSSTERSCPSSSNLGFPSCSFCLCKSSKTLHFKVPQVLGLQESSLYWCIKSSFVEITCIKPEHFSFSQVGNEQTR